MSRGAIIPIDQQEGETSRSLCIENANGLRSWIHSRVPRPTGHLAPLNGNPIYVDYYPEFVAFLNQQNWKSFQRNRIIVVNISAIVDFEAIPRLCFVPSVVQASLRDSVSTNDALILGGEILKRTGADKVFVTVGRRGAILVTPQDSWSEEAPKIHHGPVLGAGAFFSAALLIGLANGLEPKLLLQSCVCDASKRIQKRDEYADHRP
jgi:sugar/nucleoside kinase (ribokinase family)